MIQYQSHHSRKGKEWMTKIRPRLWRLVFETVPLWLLLWLLLSWLLSSENQSLQFGLFSFSSDFSHSIMTLIFCSPPCQVPEWPCCRWRCRPSPLVTPPRSPGQKMSKQGPILTFKWTVQLIIVNVFLLPIFIHFVHLFWNRAVWSFTVLGSKSAQMLISMEGPQPPPRRAS